ncbi:ricin-type beta-trefoil lectin domain protein [Nonomuraea sp. NPDC050404]|uniref:RICIN domain-containing protein n=1 Tax=Nonomuraea sp. NPDC050404 TaxID=3155783 RepID=UPI0033DFB4EB
MLLGSGLAVCGIAAGSSAAAATTSAAWQGVTLENMADSPDCLDADRNKWHYNFARVQVWDCNRQPQQQWWAHWGEANTEVRTPGRPAGPAKCLEAWPVSTVTWGYAVRLYDCNGGAHQKWDTRGGAGFYKLRNRAYNLCLDVPWPKNARNGSSVGLYRCANGVASQSWRRG